MCSCFGLGREKKMIVVEDQEVVITVKGKNVTFRMSTSSDRDHDRNHLEPVPESPKRRKPKQSFDSQRTTSTGVSSRSAFDGKRSMEYEVSPYPGHTRSCDASVGRTPHRDPFESPQRPVEA